MEMVWILVRQILQMFLLAGLGYALFKTGKITREGSASLGNILIYLALPAVIINVMRCGPGLGSIQPSQSDYWQATRALGHGDFQMVVYAPSTV